MYLFYTELLERELFISIKTDFALNNLRRLIFHKTQTNKQRNIDGTLTGSTTVGQSGPGNNGNEGVVHIPKSPGLVSLLQVVLCHIQDTS